MSHSNWKKSLKINFLARTLSLKAACDCANIFINISFNLWEKAYSKFFVAKQVGLVGLTGLTQLRF